MTKVGVVNEFELIRKHFAELTPRRPDVTLGVGDDAAIIQAPPGHELVMTTDTLVERHHFYEDIAPYDLGWKSLAVSLSDLAAMGAEPHWCLLSVTLPEVNSAWLRDFATGLGTLARQWGVALVGGDTSQGPMSVTSTAVGTVQTGTAVRRGGARVGDIVCVTGPLGDAALGLRMVQRAMAAETERKWFRRKSDPRHEPEKGFQLRDAPTPEEQAYLRARLDRPTPRVNEGRMLRTHAHAMVDLSDGLAGDLQHVVEASGVGAEIWADRLPASPAFRRLVPPAYVIQLQAAGGDDYELCACVPPEAVNELRRKHNIALTIIGRIVETPGMHYVTGSGTLLPLKLRGFQHFA